MDTKKPRVKVPKRSIPIANLSDAQFEEYMNFAESKNWHFLPAELVEHARNPDSLLHGVFEWDVQKAAQLVLEHQAHMLFHRNKQYFRKAKRAKHL